nr:pentatricopeptide repeat-containing protein At1g55630-like [Ipomoea batatas]
MCKFETQSRKPTKTPRRGKGKESRKWGNDEPCEGCDVMKVDNGNDPVAVAVGIVLSLKMRLSLLMAANIRILRRRPKWQPSNFVLLSSFSSSNRQPSKVAYSEEIQKKLADFRSRVAPSRPTHIGGNRSPSPSSFSSKDISLQEIYKRNANAARPSTGKLFDTIRMSLLDQKNDPFSLSNFKDSLRLRQGDPNPKRSVDSDW